jgi:hypothetical protein
MDASYGRHSKTAKTKCASRYSLKFPSNNFGE